MSIDRRRFLEWTGMTAVAGLVCSPIEAGEPASPRYKAVAFDAFTTFDPRPIGGRAETLFPGRGAQLGEVWRSRQFDYQWLRALAGRYEDFWRITEDGLVFAARQLRLDLTAEKRDRLMQAWLELTTFPDVPAALALLKSSGVRLAFVSNMTERMLNAAIRNGRLEGFFEHVLTTDRIRSYKPDPRAYQMAIDAFGLERDQILFVASSGWDAAGARWFGYPTYWNNRLDLRPEELGALADATGPDLADMARVVLAPRQRGAA
jgi:2-haloacid dehalogenase